MIALIVWVLGCLFGAWAIYHFGLWHELFAISVCASVFCWYIGGLAWIGKRLRLSPPPRPGSAPDIEAFKRAAQRAAQEQNKEAAVP